MEPESEIGQTLNRLLGAFWTAIPQHQAHLALVESWGLRGLATNLAARIADEPVTIKRLSARLLELGYPFDFTPGKPNIGSTLAETLQNDLAAQKYAGPVLNEAAELMTAHHDATTRALLESILIGEEQHLQWLRTELDLLDRLGEGLYVASRISASPTAGAIA